VIVKALQKQKLIIIPLSIGLLLLLTSWFLGYPLSFNSPLEFLFNHISPLYWIGLPIFLASLYLAATTTKNRKLILVTCILIVTSMYGLEYFYYLLPSSDALYVRGLTEYALSHSDLDSSKHYHSYFQWPSFFTLSKATVITTGLQLAQFEFILFAAMGVLYVMCLYAYASSYSEKGSYLAVIAYFVIMYWFLNYQFAPFSLATVFLFLLFMVETLAFRTRSTAILTVTIFACVIFVHAFAAVFFILYVLVMYALDRRTYYLRLFFVTLVMYLSVAAFFTPSFFTLAIEELRSALSFQYTTIVTQTFSGRLAPSPPIDAIAEAFSRGIVLSTGAVVALGFLLILFSRKLRKVDSAIFISSLIYSLAGAVLPILGNRAWFALVIPVVLGISYFARGKYEKYVTVFFLVVLVLFPFIPLTGSFSDREVFFQTKSDYACANFAVSYYNWTEQSSVFSHYRVMTYLEAKTAAIGTNFENDLAPGLPANIGNSDCIVFTEGLAVNLLPYNYSVAQLLGRSTCNVIFDSGSSYIALNASRFGS